MLITHTDLHVQAQCTLISDLQVWAHGPPNSDTLTNKIIHTDLQADLSTDLEVDFFTFIYTHWPLSFIHTDLQLHTHWPTKSYSTYRPPRFYHWSLSWFVQEYLPARTDHRFPTHLPSKLKHTDLQFHVHWTLKSYIPPSWSKHWSWSWFFQVYLHQLTPKFMHTDL